MNEQYPIHDYQDEDDDWYDDDSQCWQCFGEGHLGSNCIDDLCHGGECIHGDSGTIRCDVCGGSGVLSRTPQEGPKP